jgi:L-lactate dehydrogenase (cytochrome)
MRHGMLYFENSHATRGAPIIAKSVMRDFGARDHLNWVHLEQIRRRWSGNLVVKGILSAKDATRAAALGVNGIIVSNHGGRQLDGAAAPLDALPAIRDAARDVTVMMDCGVRRGTDVLKAFALGAEFVFVGRPFIYAAAIGGLAGVEHAINILSSEIYRDLGLLGVNGMDELNPELLYRLGAPIPKAAA